MAVQKLSGEVLSAIEDDFSLDFVVIRVGFLGLRFLFGLCVLRDFEVVSNQLLRDIFELLVPCLLFQESLLFVLVLLRCQHARVEPRAHVPIEASFDSIKEHCLQRSGNIDYVLFLKLIGHHLFTHG